MDSGGISWALQTIIGAAILAIAIIWAIRKNKKSSPRDIERTERATHDLYEEEDAKLDEDPRKPH